MARSPTRKQLYQLHKIWRALFKYDDGCYVHEIDKTQCMHHAYDSKIQFLSAIISNNSLHHHEICKNCQHVFLSHFYEQYSSSTNAIYTITQCSLINYCDIAKVKFIFKYTDIWRITVNSVIKPIQNIKKHYRKPERSMAGICQFLSTILENVKLFKRRHWKIITFETMFIPTLIDMVRFISDIHIKYKNELFVGFTYDTAWSLILYWLYYYNIFETKYESKLKYRHKLTMYKKQIKALKCYGNNSKRRDVFFISLNKFEECKDAISKYASTVWYIKSSHKVCLRNKCNITKQRNSSIFIKCSKCRMAVYCSRKCAKWDWKYGDHKYCCNKFIKLYLFLSDKY